MSNTDKTRPVRVQISQGDRTYYAHHSPRCVRGDVPCTLPEQPDGKHDTSKDFVTWLSEYGQGRFWVYKVRCDWWAGPYIGKHGKIKSDCGCSMCTDKRERREERRRSRHNARKEIREQLEDR